MDITGKIIAVCEVQKGTSRTGNEWKSQTFALETSGDHPRKVAFELFGQKLDEFGSLCKKDADVTISFDIESREYNGRWYTSVRAWKVVSGAVTSAPSKDFDTNGMVPPPEPTSVNGPVISDSGDDLPF